MQTQQLTEYDIDCITVMMVEAVHIAERCIQMTELYYAEQLRTVYLPRGGAHERHPPPHRAADHPQGRQPRTARTADQGARRAHQQDMAGVRCPIRRHLQAHVPHRPVQQPHAGARTEDHVHAQALPSHRHGSCLARRY